MWKKGRKQSQDRNNKSNTKSIKDLKIKQHSPKSLKSQEELTVKIRNYFELNKMKWQHIKSHGVQLQQASSILEKKKLCYNYPSHKLKREREIKPKEYRRKEIIRMKDKSQ